MEAEDSEVSCCYAAAVAAMLLLVDRGWKETGKKKKSKIMAGKE